MIIGIDPDLQKNGVAFVEGGKITRLESMRFFDLVDLINSTPEAQFLIEDVEANKPIFNRGVNYRSQLKIAQNVGQVKAVARLIIEALDEADSNYRKVKPLTGPRKKHAKTDSEYFNRITGWTGKSNQDKRDAALIALFG